MNGAKVGGYRPGEELEEPSTERAMLASVLTPAQVLPPNDQITANNGT